MKSAMAAMRDKEKQAAEHVDARLAYLQRQAGMVVMVASAIAMTSMLLLAWVSADPIFSHGGQQIAFGAGVDVQYG